LSAVEMEDICPVRLSHGFDCVAATKFVIPSVENRTWGSGRRCERSNAIHEVAGK
jgi:hypothetical protein